MSNKKLCLLFLGLAGVLSGCAGPAMVSHKFDPTTTGCFNTGAGQGSDDDRLFDNRLAQTFVPDVSGKILSISFAAERIMPTTAPLALQVTETRDGIPSAVLGEISISASEFPTTHLKNMPTTFNISADLSHLSIKLKEGRQYGLVFCSHTPEANYRLYGVDRHHVRRDPYPEGMMFKSQNSDMFEERPDDDLLFEVVIQPGFTLFP